MVRVAGQSLQQGGLRLQHEGFYLQTVSSWSVVQVARVCLQQMGLCLQQAELR